MGEAAQDLIENDLEDFINKLNPAGDYEYDPERDID